MLQTSGPISLLNIATEFGGTPPYSISDYYAGGGLVPAGTGNIPASGPISLGDFYGVSSQAHYRTDHGGIVLWQADYGCSVDLFDGAVVVTIGYGSNIFHSSAYPNELIMLRDPALAPSWVEIVQLKFTTAGVKFGIPPNILKPGHPYLNYGYGQNVPAGSAPAPGVPWFAAAEWDGANQMTIFFNEIGAGTGDNGSTITLMELIRSFGHVSGTHLGTDIDGNPAQVPNKSYTFTFR